jgi:succinoglycan biosynthesis transport protein ExoP
MSSVHELRQQPTPHRPADALSQPTFQELMLRGLSILGKHRWLAVITMILVLAGGGALSALQPRLYTASVKIVIHPSTPQVLDKVKDIQDESVNRGWGGIEQFYNTQQDILTGRGVAAAVVEAKALHEDPAWVGPLDDPETGERLSRAELTRRAINRLQQETTLRPSPKSQIFEIQVTDEDPNLAAELADELAVAYRNYVVAMRIDLTSTTSSWLERQVEGQRRELEASEQAIRDFVVGNDLETMPGAEWRNIVADRVGELTRELGAAETARQQAEVVVEELQFWLDEGHPASLFPAIANDATVRDLTAEILTLERSLTRDKSRYGDRHPDSIRDRDELALLKIRLDQEIERATGAVRISYREAAAEEKKLRARIDETSAKARSLGALEVEWNRLRRLADSNGALYSDVLRRAKELEMAQRSEASNVNILERAEVPKRPSHPNQLLNLAATFLAAVFFAFLSAFAMEQLDSSIRDVEELESVFKLRPLGVLPLLGGDGERKLFVGPSVRSTAAECLRVVRTNLLFQSSKSALDYILVTSAGPREGKTTLCSNLAATMALAGKKVLLVDTDMRRPRVHQMFDLANRDGIVDVLLGDCTPEEALKRTEIDGLDVLVCGTLPNNPAEILSSQAFTALLEHYNKQYDTIFLDSPPALLVTDASILAQRCNGVLVVLRLGQTGRRHFRDTLRALADVHAPLLGVVCNAVDVRVRGYGRSGYGYGYGYGYGGYAEGEGDNEPGEQTSDVPA